MKTSFFYFSISVFMAVTIIIGCKQSQKEEDAREQVDTAKENLKQVREDEQAAQWQEFKTQIDQKVADNEIRIAELKKKMQENGQKMDVLYAKRIDQLEQKNNEIKTNIAAFKDRSQSDWESFKREFNHDADELGKALNDIGKDNTK